MPYYPPPGAGGGGGGGDLPFADLDEAEVGQTVLYDGSAFRPANLPGGGLGPGVPTVYSQAVLAFAPLAYYRLGEDSGLMADSSGNARHGVLGGSAPVAGLVVSDDNGAQSFDGSDVAIVDDAQWLDDMMGEFTILATIKPTSVNVVRTIVARFDGYAESQTFAVSSFSFRIDPTGKLAFHAFSGNGEVGIVSLDGALEVGGTHDVAVTVEGLIVKLYVDGVPVGNGTIYPFGPINPSAQPLSIGATSVNLHEPMIGVVDEVVVFGDVLGSVDLMSLHLARTGEA